MILLPNPLETRVHQSLFFSPKAIPRIQYVLLPHPPLFIWQSFLMEYIYFFPFGDVGRYGKYGSLGDSQGCSRMLFGKSLDQLTFLSKKNPQRNLLYSPLHTCCVATSFLFRFSLINYPPVISKQHMAPGVLLDVST